MKKDYVNAVYELLLEGKDVDTVLANLATVLQEKGHERIHTAILEDVFKKLDVTVGATTSVTVTKHADTTKYSSEITADFVALNTEAVPVVYEDPTLIGGYIVEHNHTRVDRSHKAQLVTLYRNITR